MHLLERTRWLLINGAVNARCGEDRWLRLPAQVHLAPHAAQGPAIRQMVLKSGSTSWASWQAQR